MDRGSGGVSAASGGGALNPARQSAFLQDRNSDRIEATRRFFEHAADPAEGMPAEAEEPHAERLVFSEVNAHDVEPLPTMGGGFDDQRPLFQLFGGWIVTATRSGLVMVDQHRAHTRILYERFASMAQQALTGHSQQLLFPSVLEVGQADCALLESALPVLAGLGFNIELMDESGCIQVLGLPSDAAEGDPASLVDAVLEELREAGEVDAELRASRAMAGVARGAAIPAGRTLTRAEMLDVVDGLFACQEPDRDPWGRATLATFDRDAVAARFS